MKQSCRAPVLLRAVGHHKSPGWNLATRGLCGICLIAFAAIALCPLSAAELPKAQRDFFENRIRPIFVDNCYKCHCPAQGKAKGGPELAWKGVWEKGGDSGAAIVPGDPEKSLLIKAIRYTDPDLQMPPKGNRLSPTEINDLVAWVKMGAPDPRESRPSLAAETRQTNPKEHWAFQPARKTPLPEVKDSKWAHNEIDRFVLAKLEQSGLSSRPPADRRTLIRRIYYDLIGLPPAPERVESFVNDSSPGAFERIVDELLASPQYGERWARHWLDVAGYSDTKGHFNRRRESSVYPYAWTYRDYVIRAFNEDKPFNRFIFEQLAADRLNNGTN